MNEDLFYNTCEKEHLIYMLKERDKEIKYYKETLMIELGRIRNDFFKVLVKFEEEKFQRSIEQSTDDSF